MASQFKHIEQREGRAMLVNSGLSVFHVLGKCQMGDTPQEVADAFGLPLPAVREALAYAAQHPEEMEAQRAEGEALLAELAAEWSKRLGVPAEQLLRGSPLPR